MENIGNQSKEIACMENFFLRVLSDESSVTIIQTNSCRQKSLFGLYSFRWPSCTLTMKTYAQITRRSYCFNFVLV